MYRTREQCKIPQADIFINHDYPNQEGIALVRNILDTASCSTQETWQSWKHKRYQKEQRSMQVITLWLFKAHDQRPWLGRQDLRKGPLVKFYIKSVVYVICMLHENEWQLWIAVLVGIPKTKNIRPCTGLKTKTTLHATTWYITCRKTSRYQGLPKRYTQRRVDTI